MPNLLGLAYQRLWWSTPSPPSLSLQCSKLFNINSPCLLSQFDVTFFLVKVFVTILTPFFCLCKNVDFPWQFCFITKFLLLIIVCHICCHNCSWHKHIVNFFVIFINVFVTICLYIISKYSYCCQKLNFCHFFRSQFL